MTQKILAVETSGKTLSVAVAESDAQGCGVRAEVFFDVGLRHSEMLQPACDFVLRQCSWRLEDLTLLAVSTGPGSFTGLRVGIAFMRALPCKDPIARDIHYSTRLA